MADRRARPLGAGTRLERVHWRTVEHDGAVALSSRGRVRHARTARCGGGPSCRSSPRASADGRLVVAERLESHDPKVRGHPADDASAPGWSADWWSAVRCVDGGWAVRSVPHRADATSGPRSSTRSYTAAGAYRWCSWPRTAPGRCAADAAGFAAALAGLAHVVVLVDDASLRAVGAELGTGPRRRARRGPAALARLALRRPVRPAPPLARRGGCRPRRPAPRVLESLRTVVVDAATLRIDDDAFVRGSHAPTAPARARAPARRAGTPAAGRPRRPRRRARAHEDPDADADNAAAPGVERTAMLSVTVIRSPVSCSRCSSKA